MSEDGNKSIDALRKEKQEAQLKIATQSLQSGLNFWQNDESHRNIAMLSLDPPPGKQIVPYSLDARKKMIEKFEHAISFLNGPVIDKESAQLAYSFVVARASKLYEVSQYDSGLPDEKKKEMFDEAEALYASAEAALNKDWTGY